MTKNEEKRQTGYIYSIRTHKTDLMYIGCTFQPLHKRLYQHREKERKYKDGKFAYMTSYEIIKYDDHYIELIETYENVNKTELHKHEGEHIRKNNCVNKCIPGRTMDEKKEMATDYNELNKNKIQERRRRYMDKIKDKMKEYQKEYQRQNRSKLNEYQRQYQAKKKIEIENQGV